MSSPTEESTLGKIQAVIRRPKILIPILLVAFAAIGLLTFGGKNSNRLDTGGFHTVRRGNMLISIIEGGTLRAANEVSIVSQLEGQARIIYLIPEGTVVQRGDLLVELDASELEENLTQREIAFQNALSNFTEARENLSIRVSETASDIALAELKVEFAEVDQEKYIDGDWPQRKRNAEAAIQLAEEELTRAQERLGYTIELQKSGYATLAELQADRLTVTRRQLELDRSKEELRLLVEYEHPRRLRELESNLEQARAALDRTRSRANAQLSQAEANLNARKATLDLEESRLARVRNQLENTKIFAPQPGLVVYGTTGMGSSQTPIEEGATVRQRQEILKLPDLSRMLVEVKVHESQVSQVRRGQPAFVTIDSLPDRRFRGRVQRVAVLPDSQSRWLNPDLKVYTTEVLIEEEVADVNPGVSARAEIIVSQLEDTLQVPIQTVSTWRGDRVVHRYNGGNVESIPVEIGLFNDSFVQIRSGLNEGDRIMLAPPRRTAEEDFLPGMLGEGEVAALLSSGTGNANSGVDSPAAPVVSEREPGETTQRRPPAGWENLSPEERENLRRQRQESGGNPRPAARGERPSN